MLHKAGYELNMDKLPSETWEYAVYRSRDVWLKELIMKVHVNNSKYVKMKKTDCISQT